MAFTDEALKAKLSTLNETQDSIVSVSQWIMFHKRHADRIANYWLTRLRDSPPPKRLNYIYLVNDIVQNARARRRAEFPDAFSPLIPDAIQTAYRSSPAEIQTKIRRVVEVWRTRNVFETPILEAIDTRLEEVDKSKGSSGKKTLMGKSLFDSSSSSNGMPKELETLGPLQMAVTKEIISSRPAIDTAQVEYTKLNDPSTVLPSPPVHAARLSSLLKSLAAAESSVNASIKARKALVKEMERILDVNRSLLRKDEETVQTLEERKAETETKKREVEDAIIRGLSSAEAAGENISGGPGGGGMGTFSPGLENNNNLSERPEIEELTPERELPDDDDFSFYQPETQMLSPAPGSDRPSNPAVAAALAGFSGGGEYNPLTGSLGGSTSPLPTASRVRPASGGHGMNGLSAKRRKMSHGEDEQVPDLGEMGMEGFGLPLHQQQGVAVGGEDLLRNLDEDVDELLRQEGGTGSGPDVPRSGMGM